MKIDKLNIAIWALTLWSCFVLAQSLFFKFQGHEETVIIFSTVGNWMSEISLLSIFATFFVTYGGITIGFAELIAVFLLLIPKVRSIGALLTIGILSGAIFFHLFTPLGIVRVINSAGDTDGGTLFYMACSVWISCLLILILHTRHNKPSLFS